MLCSLVFCRLACLILYPLSSSFCFSPLPPSPLFHPLPLPPSFSLPLLFPSLSLASEESAAELKKAILAKVGKITDVVTAIGEFWTKGPILDQTLEEYRKVRPLSPIATSLFLPRINVYLLSPLLCTLQSHAALVPILLIYMSIWNYSRYCKTARKVSSCETVGVVRVVKRDRMATSGWV